MITSSNIGSLDVGRPLEQQDLTRYTERKIDRSRIQKQFVSGLANCFSKYNTHVLTSMDRKRKETGERSFKLPNDDEIFLALNI